MDKLLVISRPCGCHVTIMTDEAANSRDGRKVIADRAGKGCSVQWTTSDEWLAGRMFNACEACEAAGLGHCGTPKETSKQDQPGLFVPKT